VLWAALVVPTPYVEFVPNDPTPIEPLIVIEGVDTTALDGETALLTVFLRQQPFLPALRATLDDQRQLRPVGEVFRPGEDRDERTAAERERFAHQFDVAAAVGAGAAGVEVQLVTEVVVVEVLPGGPADGVLAAGDSVLAVDGVPIDQAEELQEATRTADPGDALTLTVRHAGQEREETLVLADVDGTGRGRLGVAIETAATELRLPFEVALAEGTRIGGPSAGLMVALTVYDLLSEEDLLSGRVVVGTGSITADGQVGAVGGVAEKAIAAGEYGADVMLVPMSQLEQARSTAPEGLRVIGVETFEDALVALRREVT
jgi:Lon-like protease